MATLVVYYSKTGTTKKVAETVISKLNCDFDELRYDEGTKTIQSTCNPSEYDCVILLSPIWAFSLAAPVKSYITQHKSKIKTYRLIVTCGRIGLRGCIRNCKSVIGRSPEKAVKFMAKDVVAGNFDIDSAIR